MPAVDLAAATQPPPSPAAAAQPADGSPECISLLGRPLYPIPEGERRSKLEAELVEASVALARDVDDPAPDDPAKLVWLGRRLAYLWKMRDAVELFSIGMLMHPDYAPFYRHRGHRYISLRRFDEAEQDLERAARLIDGRPEEIEPDGQPNARNLPLTTTGFNVWYHLALARYLKGDFEGALAAWRETARHTRGLDDNVVAVTDWTYMTLRRLNRPEEAAALLESLKPEMDIIENHAYHRRCLMYKGQLRPDELLNVENARPLDLATMGYGVGNWHLYNGDAARARAIFEKVVAGEEWPAFGFIAAEAELARMGPGG